MPRKFCELCAFAVDPEEAENMCEYNDCPFSQPTVIDTSDKLHQILGDALNQQERKL